MILPEKSLSGNILVILDDLPGQKVNFKVKYDFNILELVSYIVLV